MAHALLDVFNTNGFTALRQDTDDATPRLHRQVLARFGGCQVRHCGTAAKAVFGGDLIQPAPLGLARIEIFVVRQSVLLASAKPYFGQWMDIDRIGNAQRPANAVGLIAEALVVFGLFEVWEYIIVGPAGGALLRPTIVVGRNTTDVDHRIDRTSAAQHAGLD